MSTLYFGLSGLILLGFAAQCIWAFICVRQKKTDLPSSFYMLLTITHIVWIAATVAGFLSGGGKLGLRFVIEYTLVYVGGGVAYARGLLPNGFWWKVLRDPPRVPWGMVTANGWCFAAVLGYIYRVFLP